METTVKFIQAMNDLGEIVYFTEKNGVRIIGTSSHQYEKALEYYKLVKNTLTAKRTELDVVVIITNEK